MWFPFSIGDKSVEAISDTIKEFVDTPEEKAAGTTLILKTLDPNGQMRREISRTMMHLFKLYIYIMLLLLIAQSFGLGGPGVALALSSIVDLFVPVTTATGAIISASFGVNYANVKMRQ